jgi:sodium-dependent phosphate cotransporter
VFPLTLGSNIGTTVTGMIAAAGQSTNFKISLQLAICHTLFNITGILIWYPIVFMRRVPLRIATYLGERSADYKWFAIVYLIFVFLLMPGILLGLAVLSDILLYVVFGLFVLFLIALQILLVMQESPRLSVYLPVKMRTWEFLPDKLRYVICGGRPKHKRNKPKKNKVSPVANQQSLTQATNTRVSAEDINRNGDEVNLA